MSEPILFDLMPPGSHPEAPKFLPTEDIPQVL